MRKDYNELPEEIKKYGFNFHWDNQKIWELDVPLEEIDISEINWKFDLPFWGDKRGKYCICPNDVLKNIDAYPAHKDRILKADISFPIDIMKTEKDEWTILDGMHRLARLILEGNTKVKVRKISRDFIPFIERK